MNNELLHRLKIGEVISPVYLNKLPARLRELNLNELKTVTSGGNIAGKALTLEDIEKLKALRKEIRDIDYFIYAGGEYWVPNPHPKPRPKH